MDKALRPKATICLFSMIVYAQAEAVLQDDLVKARGGSNASAARSSNKNQEVERYFRIWKQMRPLEDFEAQAASNS